MTLAEFHALPEGPPYYEFEHGEFIPKNQPTANHQETSGVLFSVIRPHVIANALGRIWPEVEVDLTPGHGYAPDLTFLATENLDRLQPEGFIAGAPDLVVEILSPHTARRDRTSKRRAYQAAGVPWLWLVDPDELVIEEYRLTPDGYLLAQSVGPVELFNPGVFVGLSINLAELLGKPMLAED